MLRLCLRILQTENTASTNVSRRQASGVSTEMSRHRDAPVETKNRENCMKLHYQNENNSLAYVEETIFINLTFEHVYRIGLDYYSSVIVATETGD